MKQFTITKFTGLHVAENSTTVPDGALEKANNVVLNQDNLIQKRRGLQEWHRFPSTQFINTLFSYENSIFALSQNKLYKFDNSTITATCQWTGGSKTISVKSADHGIATNDFISDFYIDPTSLYMTNAYWENREVDFYGTRAVTSTGTGTFTIQADNEALTTHAVDTPCYFRKYTQVSGATIAITTESRVSFSNGNAYFTTDNGVIKLEDENANSLEAGIPPALDIRSLTLSQTSDSKNTGFLGVATSTGAFYKVAYRVLFGRKDSNNNVVIGSPSSYLDIQNDVITTSTGTSYGAPTLTITKASHGLVSNDIIYVYTATGSATPPAVGTAAVVTYIDPSTFSIAATGTINYTGINATGFSWQLAKCVSVEFTIPSEITSTDFFYRVYRTTQGTTLDTDFKLIEEKNLTSTQITNGYVTYLDEVYDALVSNAFLYTNANQEGELESNDRPPDCEDLTTFKNHMFYANCKQYPILSLSLLSADRITLPSRLRIADSTYKLTTSSYPLVSGSVSTLSGTTLTVTEATHGMETGDQIYVVSSTVHTPVITVGAYTITKTGTNDFTITVAAGITGTPGTLTYNKKWIKVTASSISVTVSEAIDTTAREIVAVINKDKSSLIYATYISAINEIPGKMQFIAKNFIADFYCYADDNTTITAFTPNLTKYTLPTPTQASTDLKSETSEYPNALYISKPNEPEAVPISSFLTIGTRDKEIIRIAALRDSLIILKEDGIFRLNGSDRGNFSATLLDGTVICKSANSVAILNNSVYCLSNQGMVQITDSSVRVISRPIEPLISAIIGDTNLSATSYGVAYESERTYLLSCKSPNTNLTVADNCYCYNYLSDGITTASDGGSVFEAGYLNNKEDKLYTVDSGDTSAIFKERKDQKKTDFLGESYIVQADVSLICDAYATGTDETILLMCKVPHGLLDGTRVTISKAPTALLGVFASTAANVEGLRIITYVDEYSFTIEADVAASSSIVSTLNFQTGISEYIAIANVTNGSDTVIVDTTKPHGLINAQTINIDASTITESNIPENIAITYISTTTFSFKLPVAATGTETVTVTISDKRRKYNYITLTTQDNIQPQSGDGLINGSDLYPIDEVVLFHSNKYLIYTPAKYTGLSTDLVFLGAGIRSNIRFSGITLDQPQDLKYFSEFTASFKNNSSCTRAVINFATDSTYSTTNTEWNLKVGSDKSLINFGGWGQLEWGEFAWGGEYSVNRDFYNRPAVLLRTYIPKDTFVGTFLQPIIYHNKAGESLDLQAISVYSMPVTTRISR